MSYPNRAALEKNLNGIVGGANSSSSIHDELLYVHGIKVVLTFHYGCTEHIVPSTPCRHFNTSFACKFLW